MRPIMIGLLLLTAGCSPAAPDQPAEKVGRPGQDWPSFLGPAGTSVSAEKGIIKPWPAEGLRIVWHKRVGTGYTAPVVSKGKLYIFDRQGDDARLRCLEPQTGETVWTFTYPTNYVDTYGYNNGPRCCPIVEDDRVYIYGPEGMLYCVSAGEGKEVWKVDTVKEFGVVQNFFGVGSTPVLEGDLLIVQVGGAAKPDQEPAIDAKGNGSAIVAFDKKTGKVKYKVSDELASYSSPVMATINGRRWGFVFARGGLIGFEPATGKLDFHFPWRSLIVESVNAANPVVVGDQVLISETYSIGSTLLKVKPGGYDVVWSDKNNGRDKSLRAHWTTPIYHDGYLYGDSGRNTPDADLRCLEWATGKVKWQQTGERWSHNALLMVDGHFVSVSEVGELRLIKVNPNKYEEVSYFVPRMPDAKGKSDPLGTPLLAYPTWAAPVLSHGLLYLRGKDRLVCVELIPSEK